MPDRVQLVAIAGSVFLLALILEAVRRRRLREQYALGWVFTGFVLLLLSLWRDLLHVVSAAMGIYYAPSALLLVGIGMVVLTMLGFSIAVSHLSTKVDRLSQKLAILESDVRSVSDTAMATGSGAAEDTSTDSRRGYTVPEGDSSIVEGQGVTNR